MILADALWYLNGHFGGLQEKASHIPDIVAIPERFLDFEGFNDYKRKKQKCPNLQSNVLNGHAKTLLQLASKQFCVNWKDLHDDIEKLATTFSSYSTFLDNSTKQQKERQNKFTPSRQIEKDIWLDKRQATTNDIKLEYQGLDNRINETEHFIPIFFNEELFLTKPFDSSMDRFRFFQKLILSSEVAICRYDPGGSNTTITYVWKLPENIPDAELLTSSTRIVQGLRQNLFEFHTRQMRRDFLHKFSNLGGSRIPPHIMRAIYAELTLDASADQNPEIDQRARMAILGEDPELIIDVRHLNKGRPGDTFNQFFEQLEKEVQSIMAADERRHNVEHIAHYISVPDLIKQVKSNLPDDAPIPSEPTVLFSFVPKNTHNNVSKLYKSKVPLRMSIQTRQLRASHMDDHFCAAMFKYMREYSVLYRDETTFICLDDKSKLDFGESSLALSSGVRGKKAIVPLNSMLSCLDHDCQSKGSLTPSVCLDVDIPDANDESFYRGQVILGMKDSVFQSSNPFRHAVELQHILNLKGEQKPVLMMFTDGGPDHRVTYHAVKLALIILFKRLGLEMLVAGRTAPGHSWTNPAEHIMSLLNLAFQNAALTRNECSSDMEQVLRSCGGMADIRKKAETVKDLKTGWIASLQEMITMLEERVKRVELKGKSFSCIPPATYEEVIEFEREVNQIDPIIVMGQYQQQHLKRAERYKQFIERHCIERQYCFQIKRCNDEMCCEKPTKERPWVPDPMYSDENGTHYKKLEDVIGTETSEKDRPSAQKQTVTAVAEEQQGCKNSVLVGQNVRMTVDCTDCTKPRCIYSKLKLTPREMRGLKLLLNSHDYSCGAVITTDGHIIIATPGRLEAMLEKNINQCNLAGRVKSLEVLVLDEADMLLDMGFETSINTILRYLPKQRRTGLFSATQTDEVEKLIRAGLRNPVRINVKEKKSAEDVVDQRTPSSLQNLYMIVDSDEKLNQLVNFIQCHRKEKVMVFFSTCAGVEYFSKCLQAILKNHQVLSIHGKLKQKRNKIMEKFRKLESGLLICTDVMARGIDIPDVNWVIQYDPPKSAESFVHRCGRTARIGNIGTALVFLLPAEETYVKFIEINQKVYLRPLIKKDDVNNYLPKLQNLALKDRAIFEKGARAYVSFVQSYIKHECSMIFRVKLLDFGKLATGFGLLKIPKMPELKGKVLENFQPTEVELSEIPYRDKTREKIRKQNIAKGIESSKKKQKSRPPRSVAWSDKKNQKDKKKDRKDGKTKNKKRKLEKSVEVEEDNDDDDLEQDFKMLKKLKKGKVSVEQFDKEFMDLSDGE